MDAKRMSKSGYVGIIVGAGLALSSAAQAQLAFVNFETPHVSPLALTPSGATLLAVNTADNRLEVFDVSGPSGTPVHVNSISVGLDPVSVRARTETEVWVVNHLSDSISIVDLGTGRVRATLQAGDEPADVVFAGSPQKAFVSVSQLNQVRVFDPANLGAASTTIAIQGEDPRMLAVDATGTRVYAAIFESANATTAVRQQDVTAPGGPYAGVNPPPNSGNQFFPAMTPGLPAAPPVAQIVRRDGAGVWRDDNNRNWSPFVTWNLNDHDVAIIDASSFAVTYSNGMLSTVSALGVRPDGAVTAVGLEATNEIRFEPNVQSTFIRVRMGAFQPATPVTTTVADLNPHLTYAIRTIPQAQRDQSLGDPRGIAWHPTNGEAYVSGMGSNNVAIVNSAGARLGLVTVGEGPTGVALNATGSRLYVLNKFDASISLVNTASRTETARVGFFDPTPVIIKDGRPLLYDTHLTSGLGQAACASCHIDGRTDHLAWDLGNPAGQMKAFNQNCRQPVCEDWHPMKGPMVTQSLQGLAANAPFHWRGDREDIQSFSGAFVSLQGADAEPIEEQMNQLAGFLTTIKYPPNPNRNIDNTRPASINVTGGTGNPNTGVQVYNTAPVLPGGATCASCHGPANGSGSIGIIDNPPNLPLAPQPLEAVQLRNMHEKTGWVRTSQTNNRGFGFDHQSEFDTLNTLLSVGFNFAPGPQGQQQRRDVEAMLLTFSNDVHAGVGQQVTFNGANNADATLIARFNTFITQANANAVGLVCKGHFQGVERGFVYNGGQFLSDRAGFTISPTTLRTSASAGNELTFTMVPITTQRRMGIDRDADGALDGDELYFGSDPTNPASSPANLCRADRDGSGAVNSNDVSWFLNQWFIDLADGTLVTDYDGDNDVTSNDISAFLNQWFIDIGAGSCV